MSNVDRRGMAGNHQASRRRPAWHAPCCSRAQNERRFRPMLDSQQTVADVVLDHSECAAVFQRHHIDFCCRGDLSIEAACERAGIDTDNLIAELSSAIAERERNSGDPRALSTGALIHHIAAKHHGYLRATLPFVQALATKVSRVHGGHNPRLQELESLVHELS